MTPPRNSSGASKSSTPQSLPEGTPTLASPFDHSFTLQAVMEMQKSIGQMSAKIDGLSKGIEGLGKKIDGVCDKVDTVKLWQARVTAGGLVILAVASIVWALITFIPWERVHIDLSAKTEQH